MGIKKDNEDIAQLYTEQLLKEYDVRDNLSLHWCKDKDDPKVLHPKGDPDCAEEEDSEERYTNIPSGVQDFLDKYFDDESEFELRVFEPKNQYEISMGNFGAANGDTVVRITIEQDGSVYALGHYSNEYYKGAIEDIVTMDVERD